MWDLEEWYVVSLFSPWVMSGKWYRRSYLQNRDRDTVVESKYIDNKRAKEGWDVLELGWHIYTIDAMYKIDNQWELAVYHRELQPMLWGDS